MHIETLECINLSSVTVLITNDEDVQSDIRLVKRLPSLGPNKTVN